MVVKIPKQTQVLAQIEPLLKICLIQRLSEEKALEYLEKHGCKLSHTQYYRLKKEYSEKTGDRFISLIRNEWAEEHLLVLDVMKGLEEKYWELLSECENVMDAKHILDSIRQLQGEKLMIYNETPLLGRMKEILEERVKELNDKPKRLELKKSET